MDKVNINSAPEGELESLHGVGPAVAKNIVEFRKNEVITLTNLERIPNLRITSKLLEFIDFTTSEDEIDSEDDNLNLGNLETIHEELSEGATAKIDPQTRPKQCEAFTTLDPDLAGDLLRQSQREQIDKISRVTDEWAKKHMNSDTHETLHPGGARPKVKSEHELHSSTHPSDPVITTLVTLLESQRDTNNALMHLLAQRDDREVTPRGKIEVERPKSCQIPKTIIYNGRTEWRPFIKKFGSYCARQGWNGEIKKDIMMWCLEDKASEFYTNLLERQPHLTYIQLERSLETRFGRIDIPEQLMAEFMAERQHEAEELQDWADRIFDLGFRAYPELDIHRLENLAITRFCQGCIDKAAGKAVITAYHRPSSMNDAVKAIRWFQLNSRVISAERGADYKKVRAVEADTHSKIQAITNSRPFPNKSAGFQHSQPTTAVKSDLQDRIDSMDKKWIK